MILVDTTVLVYALGAAHPLREPCRRVIAAVGEGRLSATTTVEVVQEFAHVRSRRRGRSDAADAAARYTILFAPLVAVDAGDLSEGLGIFREHGRVGAFDSVLAATFRRREHLTALISADTAFNTIERVTHLNPADPGFEAALGL